MLCVTANKAQPVFETEKERIKFIPSYKAHFNGKKALAGDCFHPDLQVNTNKK